MNYSLQAFHDYIDFAFQKRSDSGFIRTLYEQAITTHCLDTGIWEDYILYLVFFTTDCRKFTMLSKILFLMSASAQ